MNDSNQKYLTMALAYIEIGRVASLSDSEQIKTTDFQNAIAYQLFHAIELFYKYMLAKKGVKRKTHILNELDAEYKRLYPGDKFILDHPFDFSDYECIALNENEPELVNNHLKEFSPDFMDQHLRYPTGQKTGGYIYSIDASTFDRIKSKMLYLVNC
ncbi:hypothetical protein CTTA_3715 [Comamonas testosteroni]|uniref:HEPN domain-containing protein n=1 Tax=Comamonas testosteroni TaxID=285 RepID=A0A5A7MGT7_COMTE|nr:hypothetical protein [Comamonas testosteroni]GEQ76710.1 hypothetical protein CTTA_3715 [Comamonas testosteroni]